MEKSAFSFNERLILFFSITLALIVLVILFQRLAGLPDRHGDVVAVVVESKNDVRFRSADEFIWNGVRKSLKIINEDQFFIGENSKLQISTIDGTVLEFSENSMVVIRVSGGRVEADLLLGAAPSLPKTNKVSGTQATRPRLVEKAPKLEAPKLELTQPAEPPPAPKAEPAPEPEPEPVAEVVKPKPVKAKWVPAESVRAEVHRATAKEKLNGGSDRVKIDWAGSADLKPARIIIKDLQGRTVKLLKTTENQVEWSGATPGAYQVFVERFQTPDRKPSSEESGSALFEIPTLKRIALGRPIFPEPNQTILRSTSGFSLPIQTKGVAGGLETQVEFSRTKQFEQVEFREIFDGTSYVLREPLTEGIWYYRTRTIGEYSVSEWSTPLRFQILDP